MLAHRSNSNLLFAILTRGQDRYPKGSQARVPEIDAMDTNSI
jgi:hypothetical protein